MDIGPFELDSIVCGDCLEIMPHIPNKSIDMILCDLPYGTTQCKWDIVIPFKSLWEQYKRIIKDHGAIVLTASQPFTSALIMSNVKWFKYCWVWDKTFGRGHLVAKYRPVQQTEDIVVFGKSRINYYPITTKRDKPHWSYEGRVRTSIMGGKVSDSHRGRFLTEKQPTNLLTFKPVSRGVHPTQKPVKLFEYLIRTYTNENDIVLDNCIGSGTTAIAAENLDRRWIGIELDSEYVRQAQERIEKERGKSFGILDISEIKVGTKQLSLLEI